MSGTRTWKAEMGDRIPDDFGREIDIFESQIQLKIQDKLEDRLFAETRLRRGAYGQRYDNGQRFDGQRTRPLNFPCGDLTKGPDTVWDAPGMQRIKVPFGGLTPDQMDVIAELSEEYSCGVAHVTTRQDFQLHFIHIENTPDLMRRLASVGITTREACGNSVRNVTACPFAGVCSGEAFDVTPYAHALFRYLLGHPDVQEFGRKFKIAFSGCKHEPCGLTGMHDLGAIAVTRTVGQTERRGFELYVGGGLGPVPHQAKLFDEFVPEDELLPLTQAISRVFARLGEKKNRARARMKFLVAKLGIEEFRRLVLEERRKLPEDPRWTAFLANVQSHEEQPLRPPQPLDGEERPEGFDRWYGANVRPQRQAGYVTATVALPLGDITAGQLSGLADIARRFVGQNVRTTVTQNILLRWVAEADLTAMFVQLREIGLSEPDAGTIVDITACPGTDTCKLGIASSRGLAAELRRRLAEKGLHLDQAVKDLRIKISGCFNSCGQHHVADIGFYGISRRINGYTVPHFQVILGGQWRENAGAFGLAMGAVPSRRAPEVVDRIAEAYVTRRHKGETFQDFIQRIGKREIKAMLDDLTHVPTHDEDPMFYVDWGDTREFTTGDMGKGECAGEVVSAVEFDLAESERLVFEAQLQLDEGQYEESYRTAFDAMLRAAATLVRTQSRDFSGDRDAIVDEFRKRFDDTKLFHDPYAGGKFAQYFLRAHTQEIATRTHDTVRTRVEEAQLFIEAAYGCHGRLDAQEA